MSGEAGATHRLAVEDRDEGQRLDRFIAHRLPSLSRSRVQRLIDESRVTLSEGRAKSSLAVWPGLVVDVLIPRPAPATPSPEALPLDVLHDDPDFAVVNKPAGMVVHPGAGHAQGTLVNALLHRLGGLSGVGGTERPGIVHRLDRGTSGVLVVAKNDTAHRALSEQFQNRRIVKEYLALVWGHISAGTALSKPIGRDPRQRQKMSSRARKARPALTNVLESEALGGVSLIRVAIATGRTHQIRVHLSEAGHPVAGDSLYGGERRSVPPRLAPLARLERPFLHAARLAFAHPRTDEPVNVEAPLPADLTGILEALRRASGKTRRATQ